jgi:hypothetical protein
MANQILSTISAEEVRFLLLQRYDFYMPYMPHYRNYMYANQQQKKEIWQHIDLLTHELPVIIRWISVDNWSFLTTHRLIDYKIDLCEMHLNTIQKIDFYTPLFNLDDNIRELVLTMPEHHIRFIDVPNTTPYEMLGFWAMLFTARQLAQNFVIDKTFYTAIEKL